MDFSPQTPDGSPRKSAYFAMIGDSPPCGPADFATALAYLHKIEIAILHGKWHPYESTRLRKLRAKWARRAQGKDPRFNLVGTKDGRLPADVEYKLAGRGQRGRGSKRDHPHPHFIDENERRATYKRQEAEEQRLAREGWVDGDLPFDPATGTAGAVDPDSDVFEPEPGHIDLPTLAPARQYLIPGQDTKGHAHRVYCRVMPAHYRALCALERSKQFGFRTVGDVMRWCIDYGVRELSGRALIPQALSALAQMDAIREVLLDEQYYLEFPILFEQMTQTINRHLSSGAEQEAIRVISLVRHQIEQIAEPYWRQKFMDELMRHYASYIDGTRTAAVTFGDSEGADDAAER